MTTHKRTKAWIGVLSALAMLFLALIAFRVYEFKTNYIPVNEAPLKLLWGPYLTGTTSNSTVVNIKTDLTSTATVRYASEAYYTANNSYNMSVTGNAAGLLHHITLAGLEAGATYHYQVTYNGEQTEDLHFSTFPTSGVFTFVVYGDNQDELPNFSQADRHKLVAERIAQDEGVLFVLNTGDLVNDGDDPANWDRYFDAARTMLTKTPVFPTHGNHDKNALYYDIFGISPYYSFDCANAHFTILDTNDSLPGQTDWLKTDLLANKDWKFVLSHYPLYTSEPNHFGGWENFRNEWEETYISSGVDAVWNGHIHAYERYLENGIMYMVVGIGGGPYITLSETKYTGYQNSLERSLGYAKVTIDPAAETATVQIIRVADVSLDGREVMLLPKGSVFETFELSSHLSK